MAAKSGEELMELGREFYGSNPDLMDAMVEASKVLSDSGVTTSANFLTNFARWYSQLGCRSVSRLCRCFDGVFIVSGRGEYKIPNATAAYLGRELRNRLSQYPGFRIRDGHSKIDEVNNCKEIGRGES